MKIFKKSHLAIVMSIIVLSFSCSTGSDEELSLENKFDYSIYENSSEFLQNVIPYNKNKKTNNYQTVLDYANSPFETPAMPENEVLNYTNLDASEIFQIGLRKGYLTETDIVFIKQLDKDMQSSGFDFALNNYKENILSLKLSSSEFIKYNEFVNILMMTKSNYNRYELNGNFQAKAGWGCGLAILSFTVSTVFVGSTCVPNPVTIYARPIAIARAVLAYGSMLVACAE